MTIIISFGTIYIYCECLLSQYLTVCMRKYSKKKFTISVTSTLPRSTFVLGVIVGLCLLSLAQTAMQWQQITQLIGMSVEAAFIFTAFNGPPWSTFVPNLGAFMTSSLADGLLVRYWSLTNGYIDFFSVALAMLSHLGQIPSYNLSASGITACGNWCEFLYPNNHLLR